MLMWKWFLGFISGMSVDWELQIDLSSAVVGVSSVLSVLNSEIPKSQLVIFTFGGMWPQDHAKREKDNTIITRRGSVLYLLKTIFVLDNADAFKVIDLRAFDTSSNVPTVDDLLSAVWKLEIVAFVLHLKLLIVIYCVLAKSHPKKF